MSNVDLSIRNLRALKAAWGERVDGELAERLQDHAELLAGLNLRLVPAHINAYKTDVVESLIHIAKLHLGEMDLDSLEAMPEDSFEDVTLTPDLVRRAMIKIRRGEFSRARSSTILSLIERDGYTCRGCGSEKDLTVDHVLPLSKGGSDDLENLQFLCLPCNSSKGGRVVAADEGGQ